MVRLVYLGYSIIFIFICIVRYVERVKNVERCMEWRIDIFGVYNVDGKRFVYDL